MIQNYLTYLEPKIAQLVWERQPTQDNTKMSCVWELSDKDFQATTVFQQLIVSSINIIKLREEYSLKK